MVSSRSHCSVRLLRGIYVIRTGQGDSEFDTDDWKIPGGTATGQSSYDAFTKILGLASSLNTGFIVLEHDLYQQTVDMAVGYFIPLASNHTPAFKVRYCLLILFHLFTQVVLLARVDQPMSRPPPQQLVHRDLLQ